MPEVVGKLIVPRLPAAPGSPTEGQMYFDTVLDKLFFYSGTAWIEAGGGAGGGMDLDYLGDWNSATSYVDGDIVVYGGIPYIAVVPNMNTPPEAWPGIGGGGGGASGGYVVLTAGSAILPDANAPGVTKRKGTDSLTKPYMTLDFDPSTAEYAFWTFAAPDRLTPGGAVKLVLNWQANAIANSCVWSARLGASSPGDTDTFAEHALAAASTVTTATDTNEARRHNQSQITMANLDGLAPGDLVSLALYRDAAAGGDTLTVDAELLSGRLEFA